MQGLVYLFIGLAALGVAGAAYFGLTFTPIEAAVTAIAFGCLAVLLVERQLRRRAEARLEKAVEDLSRLLSTDAQAGSQLSARINSLTELKIGPRLDAIESDLGVLGTVVKQVTETVAELEETRRIAVEDRERTKSKPEPEPDPDIMPEPVIPLEMLRQAIEEHRLVFHIEPIVTLPQRRPYGYDLVPRLTMEDGGFADRPDFMPRRGGEEVIARLEADAIDEAVVIARRSRTAGTPITLFVPISRATLGSAKAVELILAAFDANRAIVGSLLLVIEQNEYKAPRRQGEGLARRDRQDGRRPVARRRQLAALRLCRAAGAGLQDGARRRHAVPAPAREFHRLPRLRHRRLWPPFRHRAGGDRHHRRAAIAASVRGRHCAGAGPAYCRAGTGAAGPAARPSDQLRAGQGRKTIWLVRLSRRLRRTTTPFCRTSGASCTTASRPIPRRSRRCGSYRKAGGRVVLITNAPRAAAPIVGMLDEMGVPRDAYDGLVSSGDVTRAMIAPYRGRVVHHIGPPSIDDSLYEGLGVIRGRRRRGRGGGRHRPRRR